jgi:hypothetical protein
MSLGLPFAADAAVAVGIASTAMPFARTPEQAAERWLRVLQLKGEVAVALEALGAGEGPIQVAAGSSERKHAHPAGVDSPDAVSRVTEHAIQIARERGAKEVTATDLLMAVMSVYGADFDRVLHAHGTDCDRLIEQLAAGPTVTH